MDIDTMNAASFLRFIAAEYLDSGDGTQTATSKRASELADGLDAHGPGPTLTDTEAASAAEYGVGIHVTGVARPDENGDWRLLDGRRIPLEFVEESIIAWRERIAAMDAAEGK